MQHDHEHHEGHDSHHAQEASASHAEHEAVFPPPSDGKGNVVDELKNNEMAAKVATIAVVGVGVALVSVELLPAMLIGAAAALLPGIGPKWTPYFKSTVRAGYNAVRKTREVVAEAGEHLQDAIAEAKSEKGAAAPTPAGPIPTPQTTVHSA